MGIQPHRRFSMALMRNARIQSLKEGLLRFSHSMVQEKGRERGGLVVATGADLEFQELQNYSPSQKRYVTVIRRETLPGPIVGFWHTHQGSACPSPTDFLQILRLNRRFQSSFALCILGRRALSIMEWDRMWPRFSYVRRPR